MQALSARYAHRFDLKSAVIIVAVNALVVFLINLDGEGGGAQASLTQVGLTFIVIGLIMPQIRRVAALPSPTWAYIVGAVLLPSIALAFTRTVHWYLETPNLAGTTLYLVISTAIAGPVFVLLKRHPAWFSNQTLRRLVADL